ncbi:hypothetical protein EDB83DRAFT_2554282 [Lactarius deliciosus]|nr:hypothetical protein EDB83DRAFT_2554282 [Lactarius deliciosus]
MEGPKSSIVMYFLKQSPILIIVSPYNANERDLPRTIGGGPISGFTSKFEPNPSCMTGGTGYLSLSKTITPSENDVSEETEAGGRLSGTAALVLASVVSCTPRNGGTRAYPELGERSNNTFRSVECLTEVTSMQESGRSQRKPNKEDTHGHEPARIEPKHDEEGGTYMSVSRYLANFVQRVNIWPEAEGKGEQYRNEGNDRKYSAE